MEVTRTDGRVVVVSRLVSTPQFNPAGHPFLGKRLNLMTSYDYPDDGHRWSRRRSVALTLDLLSRRRLNIRPILTHRFPWEQLPEVYQRLDENDEAIVGAVIDWKE